MTRVGTLITSAAAQAYAIANFNATDVAGGMIPDIALLNGIVGVCVKNVGVGVAQLDTYLAAPPAGVTAFSCNIETHNLTELLALESEAYTKTHAAGFDFWFGPARPMFEAHFQDLLAYCDVLVYQTQVHQNSPNYAAIVADKINEVAAYDSTARLWVQMSVNPRGTMMTAEQVLDQAWALLALVEDKIEGIWIYYARTLPDRWEVTADVLTGLLSGTPSESGLSERSLFNLTKRLAEMLNDVHEGEATAAGAVLKTTLIDTSVPHPDDHFDNGTIWFLDSGNAGTSSLISDYDSGTHTFTFPAVTAQTAIGDRYAVTDATFPRDKLKQFLNRAIRSIGMYQAVDTSMETSGEQETYDLPDGGRNLKRGEIATETEEPYEWQKHFNWYEQDGVLYFDEGHATTEDGYKMRLWFTVYPLDLTNDGDEASPYINLDWLLWTAAINAYRWRLQRVKEDD